MWLGVVGIARLGVGELTLVDAMLLLAVVVIVPAALPLHPATRRGTPALALAAGLPVVAALLLDRGALAVLLALPWFLAVAAGALAAAWRWWAEGHEAGTIAWPAAAAYLAVGGAWLLFDRADLEPGGFTAPIVQLTAVHFHYAGFASSVLAGCVWRRVPGDRIAAVALAAIVAAPPLVAVGFTFLGALQIAGAALLTVGLWALAWVTVIHVAPRVRRTPAAALVASSVSVLAPMLLAVQWAVGANLGTPALSIPDMVRVHGVVNAVGFSLLGVLGWRLVDEGAGVTP